MSEYQIVFDLNPDEFEEILRQAQDSGLTSVNDFARSKLLSLLGINDRSAAAFGRPDLNVIRRELQRMQSDLQAFVAESLSTKDHEQASAVPDAGINFGGLRADGAASESQSIEAVVSEYDSHETGDPFIRHYAQIGKEMEELAEQAFANSPSLGALEELGDSIITSNPLDELLNVIEVDKEAPNEPAVNPIAVGTDDTVIDRSELEESDTVRKTDELDSPKPVSGDNEKPAVSPTAFDDTGTVDDSPSPKPPPLSGGPPPRKRQS
jgi:hypothetical protein